MKNAGCHSRTAGFLAQSLLYPPGTANKRRRWKSKRKQGAKKRAFAFSASLLSIFSNLTIGIVFSLILSIFSNLIS